MTRALCVSLEQSENTRLVMKRLRSTSRSKTPKTCVQTRCCELVTENQADTESNLSHLICAVVAVVVVSTHLGIH